MAPTVITLATIARRARERESALVDRLVLDHRRGTISATTVLTVVAEISAVRGIVETLDTDTTPAPERAPMPSPGGATHGG